MGYGLDEEYADDSEFVKLDQGFSVYSNLRDDVRRMLTPKSKPKFDPYLEPFAEKEKRATINRDAKVHTKILCAWCQNKLTKKYSQQKFCCTKHKDHYWNMHPSRIERTKEWQST